jgi:hypothetical protein
MGCWFLIRDWHRSQIDRALLCHRPSCTFGAVFLFFLSKWIWRVLEPLIEQRTRDKVRIVTPSEEAEVLGALFEPSQVSA